MLVWVLDDDTVKAKAYTILGEAVLSALKPSHKVGGTEELAMYPDQFMREIPPGCRVGYVHPETKDIHMFDPTPLQ